MIDEMRQALNDLHARAARRRNHMIAGGTLIVCAFLSLGIAHQGTDVWWVRGILLALCAACGWLLSAAVDRAIEAIRIMRDTRECLAAVDDLPPILNAYTFAEFTRHLGMHTHDTSQGNPDEGHD